MIETGWDDWLTEAERALAALQARVPDGKVVVAGLSMGGALTAALAEGHPELAGIVLINTPAAVPDEMAAAVEEMMAGGMEVMDSIGGDIADPDADEASYGETPLRPLLTMIMAGKDVRERLSEITQPTLIITSRQDHVVNPEDSDVLADEHHRPGRAPLAREELPRRHPRLRQGRARGRRPRLRPEGHRRLTLMDETHAGRAAGTLDVGGGRPAAGVRGAAADPRRHRRAAAARQRRLPAEAEAARSADALRRDGAPAARQADRAGRVRVRQPVVVGLRHRGDPPRPHPAGGAGGVLAGGARSPSRWWWCSGS